MPAKKNKKRGNIFLEKRHGLQIQRFRSFLVLGDGDPDWQRDGDQRIYLFQLTEKYPNRKIEGFRGNAGIH